MLLWENSHKNLIALSGDISRTVENLGVKIVQKLKPDLTPKLKFHRHTLDEAANCTQPHISRSGRPRPGEAAAFRSLHDTAPSIHLIIRGISAAAPASCSSLLPNIVSIVLIGEFITCRAECRQQRINQAGGSPQRKQHSRLHTGPINTATTTRAAVAPIHETTGASTNSQVAALSW